MVRHVPSIAEEWLDGKSHVADSDGEFDDGASYIEAATVALTFESVRLGAHSAPIAEAAATPVTPQLLRSAMSCMATGVCVLTTDSDGEDVAMTANSVTSLSLDPPLLLVCIDRRARFHNAVTSSGRWGVSILDATAYEISSACARPDRDRVGQLSAIGHHRGLTGVALLDSSVATFECATERIVAGGDHDIIIGRVESVARRGAGSHPLLFHQGVYRWL